MKKIIALALALVMVFALCACGQVTVTTTTTTTTESAPATEAASAATEEAATVKFGLITLHDENSTYDANFINGAKQMVEDLAAEGINVDLVVKTGVSEGQDCYETACDLADQGCNVILADSFGHEDFMIAAAKEYPEVQFLHATGTQAKTSGLDNFHNAFAAIYEGRYIAGVAAGLKLQEMLDNGTAASAQVGYVGAFPYAEVISGYTSWFLGLRSIVPEATMKVTYTNSWYDETAEKEAANALIQDGAVLISQHADSMGAPTACETANVPDVTYNVSTESACPNTYLAGCKINWAPYMEYAVKCFLNGEAIATDYVGTFATGSVELLTLGASVAAGTEEKLAEVRAAIEAGELQIFDTAAFTVGGEEVTSAFATDTDGDWVNDTDEAVFDGCFHESYFQSAPCFALTIDGISLLGE